MHFCLLKQLCVISRSEISLQGNPTCGIKSLKFIQIVKYNKYNPASIFHVIFKLHCSYNVTNRSRNKKACQ